jgi:two-component system, cell cycle sensor histidine kinase and response regulator CckA
VLFEVERVRPVGCYVWDLETRKVVWSDGLYRLLGMPPRSEGEKAPADAGARFYERVHPDDRERLRAMQARVGKDDAVPESTFRVVHDGGVIRVLQGFGSLIRDASGRTSLLGAFIDITESTELSLRLAEAKEMLDETQRAAGAGSSVFDVSTGRREWSAALYDILGVDPETPPTSELSSQLTHPDDRARQAAWGLRIACGEQLPPLVVRIVRPDGTTRHLETRCRLVPTDGGPRIMGLNLDVTQRVELEARLREAAKMEAVATLAAGVAHDFNNYLTVMALQIDTFDGSRAALGPLRGAVEQCRLLTEQLLTFARKHRKASEVVDLNEAIASSVRLAESALGRGVTVETRLPDLPSCVVGDRGLLDNVVMNLLLNAADAVGGGGRVSVAIDHVDLSASDPRLDPDAVSGAYVVVSVTDDGVGIAPEHLPRLFEPYFSTKAPARGTGLGLASVYGIVKQHCGFLRVESAPGSGSTFFVYLPATQKAQTSPTRPPPDARPSLSGVVLLVEDMAPLRHALAALLADAGLEVKSAQSGQQALEILRRSSKVDVVLTDVVMPGMDGFELARTLANSGSRAPVVFMSGYADTTLLEKIDREFPGHTLVKKPFERRDLLEAMRVALDDRAASSNGA